ncbi:MAG: hypothetical protein K2X87_17770 [Gemmataceae bacterium]|nr:hypothetical protein [Gemmataceae bacterium]
MVRWFKDNAIDPKKPPAPVPGTPEWLYGRQGEMQAESEGTWEGQTYAAAGVAGATLLRGLAAHVGQELITQYAGGKVAQFTAHLAGRGIKVVRGAILKDGIELEGAALRAELYQSSKTFGVAKPPMQYKIKEIDLDWRGEGKTVFQALDEAFKKTGLPRGEFEVVRRAKSSYGKTVPVQWRHSSGAEVNVDWAHLKNGPDAPHVGWRKGGKGGQVGHIILDDVHAYRYNNMIRKLVNKLIASHGIVCNELTSCYVNNIIDTIKYKYTDGMPTSFIWESFIDDVSRQTMQGVEIALSFVESECILLILCDDGTYLGYIFNSISGLRNLLGNLVPIEFMITDHDTKYVLYYNHHQYLIGVGHAAEWVDSLPGSI